MACMQQQQEVKVKWVLAIDLRDQARPRLLVETSERKPTWINPGSGVQYPSWKMDGGRLCGWITLTPEGAVEAWGERYGADDDSSPDFPDAEPYLQWSSNAGNESALKVVPAAVINRNGDLITGSWEETCPVRQALRRQGWDPDEVLKVLEDPPTYTRFGDTLRVSGDSETVAFHDGHEEDGEQNRYRHDVGHDYTDVEVTVYSAIFYVEVMRKKVGSGVIVHEVERVLLSPDIGDEKRVVVTQLLDKLYRDPDFIPLWEYSLPPEERW